MSIVGASEHRRETGNAGIVDQNVDVTAPRCGCGNLIRVRDIELERLHQSVWRDAFDIAGTGIHFGAAGFEQRSHQGLAQTAIGTGDRGRRSADHHVVFDPRCVKERITLSLRALRAGLCRPRQRMLPQGSNLLSGILSMADW